MKDLKLYIETTDDKLEFIGNIVDYDIDHCLGTNYKALRLSIEEYHYHNLLCDRNIYFDTYLGFIVKVDDVFKWELKVYDKPIIRNGRSSSPEIIFDTVLFEQIK